MPHIVFAGERIAVSEPQLADLKEKLAEAAAAGRPIEYSIIDPEGDATWLLWTPGAPIALHDADIPPMADLPFPDLSSLGLGGFPGGPGFEPPQPPRRVGF